MAAADIPHDAADPAVYRIPQVFRYLRMVRERSTPSQQRGRRDEGLDDQDSNEVSVLFAKCHELAGREIVSLETPPSLVACVVVANSDRSFLPSRGQNRGVYRQTMNVESERLMER